MTLGRLKAAAAAARAGFEVLFLWLTCALSAAGSPATAIDRLIDFQQYRFGLPPKEFGYDATGPHGPVLAAGRPLWRVYADLFAPSPKLVLIQSSALAKDDHYPVALVRDVKVDNPKLAVSFKLFSGNLTRSAGLLWGAQDRNNYHALLVNGLDHNLRLLRMNNGRPAELTRGQAMFESDQWNSLEISPKAGGLSVWLNDRLVLEAPDPVFRMPGQVGLISHADTVVLFDDFYIQNGHGRVLREPRPMPEKPKPLEMSAAGMVTTEADCPTEHGTCGCLPVQSVSCP